MEEEDGSCNWEHIVAVPQYLWVLCRQIHAWREWEGLKNSETYELDLKGEAVQEKIRQVQKRALIRQFAYPAIAGIKRRINREASLERKAFQPQYRFEKHSFSDIGPD